MAMYPNTSLEEFCKKYPGLEPISEPCEECGGTQTTTIPFLTKEQAGLEAPPCCENAGGLFTYKGRTQEAQAEMNSLFGGLSEECAYE